MVPTHPKAVVCRARPLTIPLRVSRIKLAHFTARISGKAVMTTIKQLFSLQELDLALDAIQSKKSQAEEELTARLELEQMETALAEEQGRLSETQESHQSFRQEADILREKVPGLEERIYSGDVTTARELASAEQEAGHVRKQLDDMEMRMLELSVAADNSRSRITSLESELEIKRGDWESRQAELTQQVEQLASEEETIQVRREELAAAVDQQELQKYDILRKRKGGTAVAKVERGLCQACRMSLPTQHLQRVRSGRQTVLCSSCGRMLWPG